MYRVNHSHKRQMTDNLFYGLSSAADCGLLLKGWGHLIDNPQQVPHIATEELWE